MLTKNTMVCAVGDTSREVITLGPAGTDAEAEARKHFHSVRLVESFGLAMEQAERRGSYALVPAGYLRYDREGGMVDAWVDLHFRWHERMKLVASWEDFTRPMCLAVDPVEVKGLADVRVLALHPATKVFAEALVPQAKFCYFDAKPLALQATLEGQADACICSTDMVRDDGTLRIEQTFSPTMLWCLYEGVRGPHGPASLAHPTGGDL